MDKHGGNIYDKTIEYDFSSNINPFGIPDEVKKDIRDSIYLCEKYPDDKCIELQREIADFESLEPENIICGNGAIDIIYKAVNFLKPEKALIATPCFSEYEKALRESGSEVCFYERKSSEEGFFIGEDFLDRMRGMDLIILCQPNNPTGEIISDNLLGKVIKKASEEKSFLIIDECFMDFVEEKEKHSCKRYMNDSMLIIKAFTKIFGMPGIRLGYGLSNNVKLINALEEFGPAWSVSSTANVAGVSVLKYVKNNEKYLSELTRYIKEENIYLSDEIRKTGIEVFDSEANFLLLYSEKNLYEELLEKQILIRDCSNFRGLKNGFYRIAVRTHRENQALISALRKVVL